MTIDIKDPIIKAIISDMSKMAFKIEGLEKQVAAIGIDNVAAAPAPGPTEPDELPGMNDMDEFKPDSFAGGPERVPAAKEPPKLDDDIDPFADGIQLTEEQLQELEEDEDDDEAVDDDDGFYDCPACGGIAIISKSMNRCPGCQNVLDWSE